jgi:hypothetical protein
MGGLTSGLGERNGVRKVSGATTAQKAGDLDLAGLPSQLVSFLDFPDQLKLVEGRIQTVGGGAYAAGGGCR